ncbi:MAG: preprotein translocase subunit SecA [Bacteroidetes bacterium]|uniref:Protein translocase subunit SecA n=1 Tax=Candidatus Limisoma faecipullorum TaxID=2840854 RepID=A0A9D9INT8_9BACT|nr:preprotein translocase subunit SecA [Candidatus Limisoma faecipullorum]
MGVNDFLKKLFGNKSQRDLKEIQPIVDKINAIYPTLASLTNDELRARVTKVREELKASKADKEKEISDLKAEIETLDYDKREPLWEKVDSLKSEILDVLEKELDKHLPEVFAVVRETARRFKENEELTVTATDFDRELAAEGKDFIRIEGDNAIYKNHWMAGGNEVTWDMVHYDVQLIGGIVLHRGKIAEMATGEGKTLVATLPVFLNALTGNGVHMVTVNDYLSKRDSEWMGPLYMFHGLSVDCIDKHEPNSAARRKAYDADITFGTNNEFGFDYLRDNMATSPEDLVQRDHNYAIVDEVDSVLIDDARTPLIISGPVPKGDDQMFMEFKPNVEKVVNAQRKLVTSLLVEAKAKIASEDKEVRKEGALLLYRAYKGLPKYNPLIKYLSQDGIKPLMLETEAFYMQDNSRQMHIVTDPLYFVIDEKNRSIELTDKGIDVLTGSSDDPQFFVLPDIAAQLSALENEQLSDVERQEKKDGLMQNYAVKAERVHTVNQLLKAYTLFDKDIEYVIDDNKVKIVDEQTGRIMEGRRYSDGLHQAIEAKEGVKVEAATQTFATITLQNYFRMYHKLAGMTGTAETEAGEFWDIYKLDVVTIPTNRPVARVDMNDRVYKTKKEKYNAVIEEIQKMIDEGRPVLVGTTSVEISELLSRMLQQRHIPHNVLNAKLHQKEAEIVAQAGQRAVVTIATNMAGRGTDIKLAPEVRAAGGLAIIGTERHESRRVDRQLRGRAGRQGDPGSSVFYVSFEDTVMRLFATDRVVKMLDRLGLKEGERIEANMVTKSIENAQKRVEENNFGIRKRLLEYDDVMNAQRKVVYSRRHHALMGERIGIDIMNMIYDTVENIVNSYDSIDDYENLKMETLKTLAIELPFTEDENKGLSKEKKIDILYQAAITAFKRKMDRLAEVANPIIKDIVENRNGVGLVRVPIADGKRVYGIAVDLEEAYKSGSQNIAKAWQKAILLMSIDEAWKEHLRELDQLRQSVQNASYEQKDPLLIYKLESFNLFKTMVNTMNSKAVSILMRGQIPVQVQAAPAPQQQGNGGGVSVSPSRPSAEPVAAVAPAMPERRQDYSRYTAHKEEYPGQDAQRQAARASQGERHVTQPIKAEPKVGRNDPCPCGSGKKYKNCHGRGLV